MRNDGKYPTPKERFGEKSENDYSGASKIRDMDAGKASKYEKFDGGKLDGPQPPSRDK